MNDLSPDKAREILRDGTANGKALTSRQKRYMGWVAGGKKRRAKSKPRVISVSDFRKHMTGEHML